MWILSMVCSNLTHSEVNELNGQVAQKQTVERSETFNGPDSIKRHFSVFHLLPTCKPGQCFNS